jgi:hypothetical protein
MKRCLSTGNLSTSDPFVVVSNSKKAKKNQRQKNQKGQISATQPLTSADVECTPMSPALMDIVIDSVVKPSSQLSLSTDNCCQCDKLKLEMSSMMSNITKLSHKVEFLLSFLGLDNDPSDLAQVQPGLGDHSSSTSNAAVPNSSQSSNVNYANAVRTKPTQLSSQMRQAVMSAVYVDLHSKSARANNIVVSGVPKSDGTNDKDIIVELIGSEFNLQPIIKQCRRLGKEVTNKTQNLLVTLGSEDHVKTILSEAKQLRKSHNNFVQANVYINADLTKAEASVAYDERCRRRTVREGRSDQQRNSDGVINTQHRSQLKATVPAFLPRTGSSTSARFQQQPSTSAMNLRLEPKQKLPDNPKAMVLPVSTDATDAGVTTIPDIGAPSSMSGASASLQH